MNRASINYGKSTLGLAIVFWLLLCRQVVAQDVVWEKRISIKKEDLIYCIANDTTGSLYCAGVTTRGSFQIVPGGTQYGRSFVIKADKNGDTVFVRNLSAHGKPGAITIDRYGTVHIFIQTYLPFVPANLVHIKMTTDGFEFDKDTLIAGYDGYPNKAILASDSSILLTGNWRTNGRNGMFLVRVKPDWSYDTIRVFQPGNKSTEGNNIEELPNGRIMISGPFSNRLGSVEVDKDGSNDSSWVWQVDSVYNLYKGGAMVTQGTLKGFVAKDLTYTYHIVRTYDSTRNTVLQMELARRVPLLTGHTDGTFLFHSENGGINSYVEKRNADTSIVWKFNLASTSTVLPGIARQLTGVIYNDDQSAIFSGYFSFIDTAYRSDPYLIKIAHVGTPVTSLVKPKKGTLANESLTPWPNPTSSTVYLKQHFNQAEVHMYNLAGKEMGVYHLRFAVPIDVSGYESGVYLYRAIIDGKGYSGKILKR